jgi:hypothetical protein
MARLGRPWGAAKQEVERRALHVSEPRLKPPFANQFEL